MDRMDNLSRITLWACFAGMIIAGCLSQGQDGQQPNQRDQIRNLPSLDDACTGKSVNDTCKFKVRDIPFEGICRTKGGEIACLPKNMSQIPGSHNKNMESQG